MEAAFGAPDHVVYRPASLEAFPERDTLPVLAWANAGVGVPAALARIHTPLLYVNGGKRDLMAGPSEADFEAVDHVPAFYASRHGGGHLATLTHPGGGEFANVASAWLLWRLKDDEDAGRMFAGPDCGLCADPNWDARSKGFNSRRRSSAFDSETTAWKAEPPGAFSVLS